MCRSLPSLGAVGSTLPTTWFTTHLFGIRTHQLARQCGDQSPTGDGPDRRKLRRDTSPTPLRLSLGAYSAGSITVSNGIIRGLMLTPSVCSIRSPELHTHRTE